ncbi:MAG: cytochrome D ubiquinol oxidase subunit I [Paenibacillus sp. RIFOXYA1_FULL_44_5]|nr:MAG: cytochrome D ubiquinol oxidase subunit I [Paenibacillus sp. RIFOXYA1_FULL_44_5]
MDNLILARWQFGITTIYHFLFVPLSIGLAFLIAYMETVYVIKNDEAYKRMAKFWGKLFLINFAIGVVTGIMQEFQFGMNWSSYSRFVGDVFGAPLAVEALVSFFLESTFLGVWIFGWDKLSKRVHLASIWLVAIGTTLSAFWILTANSFMQEPTGYTFRNGRAEMSSFGGLLTNPQLWVEFPHVWLGSIATGGFFAAGISAYYLLKKRHVNIFKPSFSIAIIAALVSSILVAVVGHAQAQHLMSSQPMKMAASEALWSTSPDVAPWTVVAAIDSANHENSFEVTIPAVLSILAYNQIHGSVPGINQIQAEYEKKYGSHNYIPPVRTTFWSFRIMLVAGILMIVLGLCGTYFVASNRIEGKTLFLRIMLPAISLPYIANTTGWIMTEIGRQPWSVFGLLFTQDGVSPTVSAGYVLTTLIGFTTIYGILAILNIFLFVKFVRDGIEPEKEKVSDTLQVSPL